MKAVDGVDLFDIEMCVFEMHGEHDGGKIFSFKRCLFLQRIEEANIVDCLMTIIEI